MSTSSTAPRWVSRPVPPWVRRSARRAVAVTVSVALLAIAVPHVAGTGWRPVVSAMSSVSAASLVVLVLLWLAGLASHTVALTGALPGLSARRALTMSLTGSAVSNVLPLGGAAGIALNFRMCRAWGFSAASFTTYTVVTNVWDVLAKLVLPGVAVVLLLAHPPVSWWVSPVVLGVGAGAALCVAAALVTVVRSTRGADRVAAVLEVVLRLVARIGRREPALGLIAGVRRLPGDCRAVVDARWPRLTAGTVAYQTLAAGLLWACLHATGSSLPLVAVLAGFAVERLLTMVNLTPSGAGVVEVGLVAALVGFGGASAPVVAGVLLYRALTFGLEIPVGGVLTLGWLATRRGAVTV